MCLDDFTHQAESSSNRRVKIQIVYYISHKTTFNLYRYSQHLKWSKLHHFPEEKDPVVSSQEEPSSDEDADVAKDGDNEGSEVDDDDDVRIDDVLRELVNKESSETVTDENCCNNDEAGCYISSKIFSRT